MSDIIGDQASETFNLAASPGVAVGNLTETKWSVGEPGFNGTMAISAGTGSFALTGVTGLPPGLSATLSGATVSIKGMPLQVGTYAGSVTVALK